MTDRDRAALAEKHPDAWVPVNPGDVLEGKVIDIQEAWSDVRQSGSFYPLLTVELEDGTEKKVHAFGAVLYNEILRQRPIAGDKITITYLGVDSTKEAPKGRNLPERYRVRVAGRSAEETANRVYGRLDQQGDQREAAAIAASPAPEGDDQEAIPY